MVITAYTSEVVGTPTKFVLPIVSPQGELISQISDTTIIIEKPQGIVRIASNVRLKLRKTERSRTFNMVPGVEAVPIDAFFVDNVSQVEIEIKVEAS